MTPALPPGDLFDLLDWKRRVAELYAEVRTSSDPGAAWTRWREVRAELFGSHPQSPIPADRRASHAAPSYFDFDPDARVLADVAPAEPEEVEVITSDEQGGAYRMTRFAVARFELHGEPLSLDLHWLGGYGGGLFVAFRDATSGRETYGAGRYLLDTIKGADLERSPDGRLVLDFNFAYQPSCSYDPQWACPLAPPSNWLAVPIRAGERTAGE